VLTAKVKESHMGRAAKEVIKSFKDSATSLLST
jgi:hypothetical protein